MSRSDTTLIEVTAANVATLPCCGIKNVEHEGRRRKVAWLQDHLEKGLRARILVGEDGRQCGYVEYLPGAHAWRGVDAAGYMVIQCIWTFYRKYQHRGKAAGMVRECIAEARKAKMLGVAVVARRKPWLASSDLFLKCGFRVVATAGPDYELLVKKFSKTAPDPKFRVAADALDGYADGLTIISSDQCPHGVKFAREIGEVAENEYKLKPRLVVLRSAEAARNAPTPYSVFSIVYNGTVLADHQISKTRFRNIMNKTLV
jgi:L-amino acid N-acyltransferase YncA